MAEQQQDGGVVGVKLPQDLWDAFQSQKRDLASKGDPMSVTDASVARMAITEYLIRNKKLKKDGAR